MKDYGYRVYCKENGKFIDAIITPEGGLLRVNKASRSDDDKSSNKANWEVEILNKDNYVIDILLEDESGNNEYNSEKHLRQYGEKIMSHILKSLRRLKGMGKYNVDIIDGIGLYNSTIELPRRNSSNTLNIKYIGKTWQIVVGLKVESIEGVPDEMINVGIFL